jgi:2-oxoglutaroyl-CoA hydrolase
MSQPVHQAPQSPTVLEGLSVDFRENRARADIVIDRPSSNLLSIAQCEQLCAVFEALDLDPNVRVIVLRGTGEHFSRGSDSDELVDASPEDVSRFVWNLKAPSRCGKPVIAVNRGYCFGVAFELSLACDFRIVTETTMYALVAQKNRYFPGPDVATSLRKYVGIGRARDILMRPRLISGMQAAEWGIATEFAVDSELESATDALARELLTYPFQDATKKLLNGMDDVRASGEFKPEPRRSIQPWNVQEFSKEKESAAVFEEVTSGR